MARQTPSKAAGMITVSMCIPVRMAPANAAKCLLVKQEASETIIVVGSSQLLVD